MKYLISLFLIVIIAMSCKKESKVASEIAEMDVDFVVERFDLAFAEASPEDLSKLKDAFPFMFSVKYQDSFWINKMQDTLQRELYAETKKQFVDFQKEKEEITKLFQHLKYYFPDFSVPRVVTSTSSVDYRNKVIVTDTITLISLDTYLGADHFFYEGLQNFIGEDLNREQLVVDMASKYAERYSFQAKRRTLLDEFIYAGKQLYFKDKVIPFKTDAEKISYTQEELDWAMANEAFIWRYFVERELLFSTDSKLPNRFINAAPFSKFYLEEIDNESPDRIGQYIGWQIVKAYMEKNNVSFNELLGKSTKEIFNKANFKPRK